MNYDGIFYSCMLSEEERTALIDTHNDEELVPSENNFLETCAVFGDFFCSPDGEWELSEGPSLAVSIQGTDAPGVLRDTPKSTPDGYFVQDTSCCPSDACWNGTTCIGNEADVTEPINPLYDGNIIYRCIDGGWQDSVLQWTWDGSVFGYCPSKTQCLVDIEGSAEANNQPEMYGIEGQANPQCIESGQYAGDHVCENASWTTRTKTIATQLLDIVHKAGSEDNYNLYCDYYKQSLADYGYESIEEFIRGDLYSPETVLAPAEYRCPGKAFECVNNFCILRLIDGGEEKVVLGTALNTEINDPSRSFLEAINKDNHFCDSLVGQGLDFERCQSGDNTVWYSDEANSIIFSDQGIIIEEISTWDAFVLFIKSPIQGLINWFTGEDITAPPGFIQGLNFTQTTKDYDTIYLARAQDKSIQGIIETPEPSMEYLAINYQGFDEDICRSADIYAEQHPSDIGYTFCEASGDEQRVISYQSDVLDIWQHFTSKIRLS